MGKRLLIVKWKDIRHLLSIHKMFRKSYIKVGESVKEKSLIDKIKGNSKEIEKICDCLEKENTKAAPEKFYMEVKRLEQLIVEQYCGAKNIIPPAFLRRFRLKHTTDFSNFIDIITVSESEISFRIPVLPHKSSKEDLIIDITHFVFQSILKTRGSIPHFLYHTIEFKHVYPPSEKTKKSIMDHDNYNIRGVINIIVLYINSSDSGVNSWHSHKTILSADIPMGTYITIKKRTHNIP